MEDRDQLAAAHFNLVGHQENSMSRRGSSATANDDRAWSLYDALIAEVPEEVRVIDYALGLNWSYLEAECGAGVAYTLTGGAKSHPQVDLRGRSLKDVATLSKSWCFEEATLGIAALNAWYGRVENLNGLGAIFDAACPDKECGSCDRERGKVGCEKTTDAFECYKPAIEGFASTSGRLANVVVVGHFPHVESIEEYAHLTVLERRCRNDIDTPDPACEYTVPASDFAFLTGVTLINKTMPRLLQLAANAETIVVGPSAVASQALFDHGVNAIAGRRVIDPERARFSVATGLPFGDSLQSFIVKSR